MAVHNPAVLFQSVRGPSWSLSGNLNADVECLLLAELRRISGHTEAGVCRRGAPDVGYHLTDPTTSF